VGEVAKLFADGGIVALASFISPYREDRENARAIHDAAGLRFFECYVGTPLEVCESRDPKGLYKKARAGIIKGFTGIDGVYEEPVNPDIVVGKHGESIHESVQIMIKFLEEKGILAPALSSNINELFVADNERASKEEEAATLPKLNIDELSLQWVQVIEAYVYFFNCSCCIVTLISRFFLLLLAGVKVLAEGWASPLKGFMREKEYLQVLHFNFLRVNGGITNMVCSSDHLIFTFACCSCYLARTSFMLHNSFFFSFD
jgi:3'-phosphoadenosine 5'-phosphosulfate synthase